MMKQTILLLLAGILLAGCDKRGPVELRDSDMQAQNLEVLALPAATAPEFSLADIDSAETFSTAGTNAYGQLTIVGATCDDGEGPARQVSMVHAAFYDRSLPVVAQGRTVGYAALDFGTVTVDDLLVTKSEKRFHLNGADTVAGVHYSLIDWGRSGGRGFQYTGNHQYEWRIGGGPFPGFQTTIVSPPEVRILGAANSNNAVALSHTLKIKWSNHIETVRVLISEILADGTTRPLLHLRSRSPENGVAIPSSLLQTLRSASRVRISVIAENTRTDTLPGYPDELVLKAVSLYSVVMRINR